MNFDALATTAQALSTKPGVDIVFGQPVTVGQRTVIPVSQVHYRFGVCSKKKGAKGTLRARPCGALEITPHGTRFVTLFAHRISGLVFAAGVAAGLAVAALVGPKQIKIIKAGR